MNVAFGLTLALVGVALAACSTPTTESPVGGRPVAQPTPAVSARSPVATARAALPEVLPFTAAEVQSLCRVRVEFEPRAPQLTAQAAQQACEQAENRERITKDRACTSRAINQGRGDRARIEAERENCVRAGLPFAQQLLRLRQHHEFKRATSAQALAQFVRQHRGNDPDGWVPKAEALLAEQCGQGPQTQASLAERQEWLRTFSALPAALCADVLQQVALVVQKDEYSALDKDSEAALRGFINSYRERDAAALVPAAQEQLDSVQKLAQAKAAKEAAERALLAYREAHAAIDTEAAALRFIEQYAANDPQQLVPGVRSRLAALQVADQKKSLEAISNAAQAQAHIDRYAGKDAARTVAQARQKLAAYQQEEKRRLAEAERERKERVARQRGLVNQFVSWREEFRQETDDCISLLLVRKCMWVTYQFDMRGKVEDLDEGASTYLLRVVDAKLAVPGAVSVKYMEFRSRAVQAAQGQWVGQTVVKPVSKFLN